MVSKPKKRQVRKVISETQEPLKQRKQVKEELKPTSVEALIIYNADLVNGLLSSKAWTEIAQELINEGIASVQGRYTNGRWHYGADNSTKEDLQFLRGYKKSLMDFTNRLNDFLVAKDNLIKEKKKEELDKNTPISNPFLEELL